MSVETVLTLFTMAFLIGGACVAWLIDKRRHDSIDLVRIVGAAGAAAAIPTGILLLILPANPELLSGLLSYPGLTFTMIGGIMVIAVAIAAIFGKQLRVYDVPKQLNRQRQEERLS